jgi:DNA-binding CsgD family transcriptional regulator
MKQAATGQPYGGLDDTVGIRTISEFRLGDDYYWLVEVSTAAGPSLSNDLLGATDVGHCEINGKTYTVMKADPVLETDQEITDILTERELEIATLVSLGRPNKQIADKLHISEWTVSTHLRRIFAKLGVHSRAAMVYRCAPLLAGGR